MKTEDIGTRYSPWQPERNPVRLAVLGKAIEESSELTKELARCIIQGFEASHPETGEPNRCALADELDDMEALIHLIRTEFYVPPCKERFTKKVEVQRRWYQDLYDGVTPRPSPSQLHKPVECAMGCGETDTTKLYEESDGFGGRRLRCNKPECVPY